MLLCWLWTCANEIIGCGYLPKPTTTIEYVTLIKVLWKSALMIIVVSSGGAPNVICLCMKWVILYCISEHLHSSSCNRASITVLWLDHCLNTCTYNKDHCQLPHVLKHLYYKPNALQVCIFIVIVRVTVSLWGCFTFPGSQPPSHVSFIVCSWKLGACESLGMRL